MRPPVIKIAGLHESARGDARKSARVDEPVVAGDYTFIKGAPVSGQASSRASIDLQMG